MTSAPVLAVDIGSTAVKAARFDVDGSLHGEVVTVRHRGAARPAPGEVEPHALRDAVVAALRDLELDGVERVVASSVWHALLAVDAAGQPLGNALSWEVHRPASQRAALEERLGDSWSHEESGGYLHPSYAVAVVDELAARGAARIVDLASWVMGALAGTERAWPENVAAGSGLWLSADRTWNRPALDRLGVDPALFGTPWSDAVSGANSPIAELRGAVWLPPFGDGMCHNLGQDAIEGRMAITLGTSGSVRAVTVGGEVRGPGAGLWRYRVDDATVVTGGAVTSAGNTLEWVREVFGTISWREATPERIGHLPRTDPSVFGRRGPDYPWSASGSILGLVPGTTRDDIALALGIDLWHPFAAHFGALTQVLRLPNVQLVVEGGVASGDPAALQLLADALGTPLQRTAQSQPALAGAARVAVQHLRSGRVSIDDTVRAVRAGEYADSPIVETIEPRPAVARALAERWAEVVQPPT